MIMGHLKFGIKLLLFVLASFLFFAEPLFAHEASTDAVSWRFLIIGLLGGLALFLYGMAKMSDAMKPLHTYPGFIDSIKGLENPLLGLMAGTVFTALVQNSSAATSVVYSSNIDKTFLLKCRPHC